MNDSSRTQTCWISLARTIGIWLLTQECILPHLRLNADNKTPLEQKKVVLSTRIVASNASMKDAVVLSASPENRGVVPFICRRAGEATIRPLQRRLPTSKPNFFFRLTFPQPGCSTGKIRVLRKLACSTLCPADQQKSRTSSSQPRLPPKIELAIWIFGNYC